MSGVVSAPVFSGPVIFDDMNPIELIWSFVKGQVRREGPRDEASRRVCVAAALASVTEELVTSCFRHCAYSQ